MSEQRTMLVPGQGIIRPPTQTFDHNEYPKHLAHKDYQPGRVGPKAIVGGYERGIEYNLPGTAVRFAPQLVYNKAQEEYYLAQGYHIVGKSDPDAFRRLVTNMADPAEHREIKMYPKWVNGVLCQNEADETVQLARLAAEKTAMEQAAGATPSQVQAPVAQVIAPVAQVAPPVATTPPPAAPIVPAPDPTMLKFMESVQAQMAAMTSMIGHMRADIDQMRAPQEAPTKASEPEPPPEARPLTHGEKTKRGREAAAAKRKAEAEAARARVEVPATRKKAAAAPPVPPPEPPPRTTGGPDDLDQQMLADRARSAELERRRQEEKAREAREGLAFLAPPPDEAA